jgi:zinc D-Ala-D-Ala carboxypeptidase
MLLMACNQPKKSNELATPAPLMVAQEAIITTTIAADSTKTPVQIYPLNELMGRINQATHPDFRLIKKPYTQLGEMYLRTAAAAAYEEMWHAAQRDGVYLTVVSSTRNFDRQTAIWNGKWAQLAKKRINGAEKAKQIMLYSAMPGCSRHHWGTDIDLNSLNNTDFSAGAKWNKTYEWLVKNAASYGFCQVYSARSTGRSTGYEEERWHWSFTPLAKVMLEQYVGQVQVSDIKGFEGSAHATELDVIKNYVLGISEACK